MERGVAWACAKRSRLREISHPRAGGRRDSNGGMIKNQQSFDEKEAFKLTPQGEVRGRKAVEKPATTLEFIQCAAERFESFGWVSSSA